MSDLGPREPVMDPRQGVPLDALSLRGLQVRCIVGLYPSERVKPQPLEVGVTLHLDTRAVAEVDHLARGVDYARVAGELRFLLESCRFRTLEAAAHALARYLLAPGQASGDSGVVAVDVVLDKPEALAPRGGGAPRLAIRRWAADQRFTREAKPWGAVDVVHEVEASDGHGSGGDPLRSGPGRAVPPHLHQQMDESELVLGSQLRLQGEPVAAGSAFDWPRGFAHRWDNPSDREQTLLCVARPRFDPADEIETDAPLLPVVGRNVYPPEGRGEQRGGGA